MVVLNQIQKTQFQNQGYLLLENAIPEIKLDLLNKEFDRWVEESREQQSNYGETLDGRPRFSVQPGHNAERPGLRRIASPNELSDNYLDVMRSSIAVDAVCDLFGPNLRFNNAKINSKLPGAGTEVKYHQDFPFELHSNDDLMTVLYFLDDVTEDNGPLEVVPGSHKGPLHDHWHNGVFTGAVSDEIAQQASANAVTCTGKAGSACLMHTRLLHGSAPNQSNYPRTLFICAYNAEDSHPVIDNHIPSIHSGEIVRGEDTGRIRCSQYETQIAEKPGDASFFEQQAQSNNNKANTQQGQ